MSRTETAAPGAGGTQRSTRARVRQNNTIAATIAQLDGVLLCIVALSDADKLSWPVAQALRVATRLSGEARALCGGE